jgi:hypothetical protein
MHAHTQDSGNLVKANQVAGEAVGAVRTVAAFSLQDVVSDTYHAGMGGGMGCVYGAGRVPVDCNVK